MRSYFDIIADKRDGKKLSEEDIRFFLSGYLNGEVLDYQMSALLMAVYIQGLDTDELGTWAMEMLHSGEVMDFSDIAGIKCDKHSTGGVGDKISIPLAPLLGSLGLKVPMISGRGLGHTGGTLDKLESISGFNVNLSNERFRSDIEDFGVSMIGQTPSIAPLDKKLYALRDVTATVSSIPMIACSIMSKKMAEGIDGLILDVKVGNGAFMKTISDAEILGQTMKNIGEKLGKKITVLFTNMNEPLGYTVGNALEIAESIDVLKGIEVPQVTELTLQMAARLLLLFEKVNSLEEGLEKAKAKIDDGSALSFFYEMVKRQGGEDKQVKNPLKLPQAKHSMKIFSEQDGFIREIHALSVGKALVQLGGGRIRKEDDVDHSVGFIFAKKVGDEVKRGDLLYTIHFNDEIKLENARSYLETAVKIVDQKFETPNLILGSM